MLHGQADRRAVLEATVLSPEPGEVRSIIDPAGGPVGAQTRISGT